MPAMPATAAPITSAPITIPAIAAFPRVCRCPSAASVA